MKKKTTTRKPQDDAYFTRCFDAASELHDAIVARAGHLPTDEDYREAWDEWWETMEIALRWDRDVAEREAS